MWCCEVMSEQSRVKSGVLACCCTLVTSFAYLFVFGMFCILQV